MNRSVLLGSALVIHVAVIGIGAAPLPEPTLQDDKRNIQGFWILSAAGNRNPIILRFHNGFMKICEYCADSSVAFTGPSYDLKEGENSRIICRKDADANRQFITYRLNGDRLILDDESSAEKLVDFTLGGEYQRIK